MLEGFPVNFQITQLGNGMDSETSFGWDEDAKLRVVPSDVCF